MWMASASYWQRNRIVYAHRWGMGRINTGARILARALEGVGEPEHERLVQNATALIQSRGLTNAEVDAANLHDACAVDPAGVPQGSRCGSSGSAGSPSRSRPSRVTAAAFSWPMGGCPPRPKSVACVLHASRDQSCERRNDEKPTTTTTTTTLTSHRHLFRCAGTGSPWHVSPRADSRCG